MSDECRGPLRIGIIAPDFPPEIGGMQTYAYEFSRELAKRGIDVTVFTRSNHVGYQYEPGVRVLPVLTFRRWRDRPLLMRFLAEIDVWHVMTAAYAWITLDCDRVAVSIHGNDFLSPPATGNLDLRLRWKLPFGSRLDYCIGIWRTLLLLRQSFPRARHIFANSRYTEDEFLKRHPFCRGRTSVTFVGLPEASLQQPLVRRTRTLRDRTRLVTVCRLGERRKNVDLVLEALARLKGRHPFHYTIIGDGPDRSRLEELARQRAVSDCVTFLGFISAAELRAQLESSDLFILAASASNKSIEGFGICYLEANAAGTPVLAARVGGAVDAVEEGVSGMFVDEPSIEQIEKAVERFLKGEVTFDPAACRAFAGRFRWSSIVDQALTVYSSICNVAGRIR